MAKYILKRLLQTVVILIIISIIAFSLIHFVPGDPVYAMLGTDIPKEYHDQVYHTMGLDKPVVEQYFYWLGNILKGDFGYSYYFRQPVAEVVARRLPTTLYLGIVSAIFSVVFGIFFGIISAVKRNSPLDSFITVLANIGNSMPIFWFAVILILVLGLNLKWLPVHGFTLPWEDFATSIKQSIMPVICLSIGSIAIYTRQTRSSMLEVIRQDYIRTARSKGLKETTIVSRHALKNALIPILTLVGLTLRSCFGGSAIIETIFNITGLGQVMVMSLNNRDYTTLQSSMLFLAAITCLINLLVDIAYAYADPRIRLE